VNQRPWYVRMLDRDNPAAPVVVLVLLVLVIAAVLFIGPLLDQRIEGDRPRSHQWESPPLLMIR
jgi:hypothetical protein